MSLALTFCALGLHTNESLAWEPFDQRLGRGLEETVDLEKKLARALFCIKGNMHAKNSLLDNFGENNDAVISAVREISKFLDLFTSDPYIYKLSVDYKWLSD